MSTAIPSRPRQIGLRRTFAIVSSQYNTEFVSGLVDHARRELEAISQTFNIVSYEVPGAFEIPLVAQEVASRGGVDAIIALGVLIEGETQHAALIAKSVTHALQQVSLTQRLPVIHEVLMVKNEAQALALTEERSFCIPDDIKRLVLPVFAHRILVSSRFSSSLRRSEEGEAVLEEIIKTVSVPL